MSVRVILLWIAVGGLAVYAWRDWFKSLCGLILLMAVMLHEDMPTTIMGIQGLNPWNVLLVSILLAWAASWGREKHSWDMPGGVTILLGCFVLIIIVGFLRALADRSHLGSYPLADLISEELINTLKRLVPGVLVFMACRDRKRSNLVVASLLVLYLLLALQVMRRIPPVAALGGQGDLQRLRLKLTGRVGYSASDLSTMLAGASWSMLAVMYIVKKKIHKIALLVASGATVYAQALTGGRVGWLAWGIIGLTLGLLRWRKGLLLAPVLPILLYLAFPGSAQRMLQGFGHIDPTGRPSFDYYSMTSGRTLIWPFVCEEIGREPLIGHGRLAMIRTGLASRLMGQMDESFPHPHNIYLEWLLDNGIVGLLPVLALFGVLVWYSTELFARGPGPLAWAVGAMSLSLVLAQLVAGIGSQHFYPRESTVGMWVAVFLMLRVRQQWRQLKAQADDDERQLVTGLESWQLEAVSVR